MIKNLFKKFSNFPAGIRLALSLAPYGSNPIRYFKYLPSSFGSSDYCLTYHQAKQETPLPVPPKELWLGYGSDETEYLESGKQDIEKMVKLISDAGWQIQANYNPILDLGCGGGRMIRHLRQYAAQSEIWGMDISAPHINWLKTHLSPPFHFAVNTTIPHLPFSDDTFGLIYCGSLFTHIDDLAESWFLELRRLLKPGGVLFCTIHDEHTLNALSKEPFHPIAQVISKGMLRSESGQRPDILVSGQDSDCNVFYKNRYLTNILSGIFQIKGCAPSAYGYQTGYILSKK